MNDASRLFDAYGSLGGVSGIRSAMQVFAFNRDMPVKDLLNQLNKDPVISELVAGILSVGATHERTIGEISRERDRLSDMAYTNSNSGMPNDRQFDIMCKKSVGSDVFTLAYGDLDDFRDLNTIYKHEVVDRILGPIGEYFMRAIRRPDAAANLHGDEFGFLFMKDATDAEVILRRVSNGLRTDSELLTDISSVIDEYNLKLSPPDLSISIGMYTVAAEPNNFQPKDLMREIKYRANLALAYCKKNNKGDICSYDASMDRRRSTDDLSDKSRPMLRLVPKPVS